MGKLYVNNNLIELPPNFKFARTKQANDISEGLNNRQTNYTQSIKIPKTKANIKAFNFLGTLGGASNVPYTVSNIRYVNDSGEDEIYNGTGIFKSSNKYFNLSIYDGYISFFKKIENKVITDIGISEVNHLKNIDTVIETWTNSDLNYRYNIADYNGNALIGDAFNIDYLVPSVKFSFIWQKIHEYAGFEYTGSIFSNPVFNNLWITYPKSNNEGSQQVVNLISNNQTSSILLKGIVLSSYPSVSSLVYLSDNNDSFSNEYLTAGSYWVTDAGFNKKYLNNAILTISKPAVFKIEISGIIDSANAFSDGIEIDEVVFILHILRGGTVVNGFVTGADVLNIEIGRSVLNKGFNFSINEPLEEGDRVDVQVEFNSKGITRYYATFEGDITTNLSVVTGSVIDFEEAFIDFSIKDFINQGLFLFGLTPYKAKYDNSIEYLTTDEVINSKQVVDWSSDKNKFIEVLNEVYILKGYAQRNNFEYKYNDVNFDHNNAFFTIPNKSIKDKATVIKSEFFSPDALKNKINDIEYNTYPIWSKEPKEDGTIKYKELSNRFYIMGSEKVQESIDLVSARSNDTGTLNFHYRENFKSLSFREIISKYYQPLKDVLQRARVITANVYLTDADVFNVKFQRPVFIKEQGGYFLINKISNYIKKGVNKVELMQVERRVTPINPNDRRIEINAELVPPLNYIGDWNITINIRYFNYIPYGFILAYMRPVGDLNNFLTSYVPLNGTGEGVFSFSLPTPLLGMFVGKFEIAVEDDSYGLKSNTETITVPDSFSDASYIGFHINTRGELTPDEDEPITYRLMKFQFFNTVILSQDITIQVDDQAPQQADLSNSTGKRETFVAFNDGFKEYTVTVSGGGYSETKTIYIN